MIGVDIVSVARIEDLMEKEGFLGRIFTDKEIKILEEKNYKPESVAGRFAAKEAVSKALGTGIGEIGFKDIEILADSKGKPLANISKLNLEINVSISHEKDFAVASAQITDKGEKKLTFNNVEGLAKLKPRPSEGHKGSFGKVGIIGGSKGMEGSVVLSSKAALRTGSGLVYTIVPESIGKVVAIKSLENIVISLADQGLGEVNERSIDQVRMKIEGLDALAIGPGLGRNEGGFSVLEESLRLKIPTLIDADGLYHLSKDLSILDLNSNTILTPHEQEMSRLIGGNLSDVSENREEIAKDLSKRYNTIVVLKGKNTVVTDGDEVFINPTGSSALATGGSGDVLTGIILSFMGQGYDIFDSAKLGVYIHGLAGDIGAFYLGEDSLIASDIIKYLPQAIIEKRKEDCGNSRY